MLLQLTRKMNDKSNLINQCVCLFASLALSAVDACSYKYTKLQSLSLSHSAHTLGYRCDADGRLCPMNTGEKEACSGEIRHNILGYNAY